jgi:hypothetical protein
MKSVLKACILFTAFNASLPCAFDLTPDRGALRIGWPNEINPYGTIYHGVHVFNVGIDNWGPVYTCDGSLVWARSQWRLETGKRHGNPGTTPTGAASFTDVSSIQNGWFIPNPQNPSEDCAQSHISRGWGDTWSMLFYGPLTTPNTSLKFTLHTKVDPNNALSGDENKTNNEAWITFQHNGSDWIHMENIDLSSASTTLTPTDSIFYGAYSTDPTQGSITITNKNRTMTLADGNEKLGFQARRMKVTLTGGTKNTYVVKLGAKVTAEFLAQNQYD